jgi:hypothetical protein
LDAVSPPQPFALFHAEPLLERGIKGGNAEFWLADFTNLFIKNSALAVTGWRTESPLFIV